MPGRSLDSELKELQPAVVQFDVVHARFLEVDVERRRHVGGRFGLKPDAAVDVQLVLDVARDDKPRCLAARQLHPIVGRLHLALVTVTSTTRRSELGADDVGGTCGWDSVGVDVATSAAEVDMVDAPATSSPSPLHAAVTPAKAAISTTRANREQAPRSTGRHDGTPVVSEQTAHWP
jgi:hypothetical protein